MLSLHKIYVALFILSFIFQLIKRVLFHDISKYEFKEAFPACRITGKIKYLIYGSKEYFDALASVQDTIILHYSRNRHHPEYFNDYKKMSFVDLIEMTADWAASSKKNLNNGIEKSVSFSIERFKISEEIGNLLRRQIKEWIPQKNKKL